MSSRPWSGVVIRLLLALAPAAFRERYGREILNVHRARARAVAGERSLARRARFAAGEITGTLALVLRLRLRPGAGAGSTIATTTGGGGEMMGSFVRDTRHAFRTLRRHPAYAATTIVVLALGIGATTAIFSAVNAFFFRPLPFGEPERLVAIYETNPEFGWTDASAAPANVLDWRERVDAFEDVAMYSDFTDDVTYILDGEPTLFTVVTVTGNFFDVLGVRPALGRGFTWDETWDGRDDVVVMSHDLWRTAFGADPEVVGRVLDFGGTRVEVLGVMPEAFRFPTDAVDLWTPWGWQTEATTATWFRRAHFVRPVARLAPGASHEQASAELQAVMTSLQSEYPETNRVMGAGMAPLRDFLIREVRGPLLLLQGAVLVLLLLSCVNVANLALVRASGRAREVTLRRALGAARSRVAAGLMVESVVLALAGGAVGLGLGWAGVRALEGLTPLGIDGATTVTLDGRVVLVALGISLACGLLFGLAPVLRTGGLAMQDALKEGERGGTGGGARSARVLVAAEVALALLLVVGAGLMVRTSLSLRQVDPGFRTEGVLAVQLSVPAARYQDRDAVHAFQDELLARLEARPGIERAGIVGNLPLDGPGWSSQFQAEGWPPERVGLEILHRRADPGYFEAVGVPLVRGRMFDRSIAGADMPLVILINETFAAEHFPGEDPIGQKVAYDRAATPESTWREIIGIVGDQHQVSPGQPPRAEAFEPRWQDWSRTTWIVLSTAGEPMASLPTVRAVLQEMDPLIPLESVRPLRDVWRQSMAREELVLTLLGVFAVVALLLASVGVYGVTAQAAGRRRREMGIRMALGAGRGSIVGLVVRQGMTAVLLGLAVGIGASLVATRSIASYLYRVEPTDPLTLSAVAALLGLAGLLACWLPARRATRVDPSESLRRE